MINIKRTDSENHDFKNLVFDLDKFLKTVDGEDNDFYHQFNGIENLKYVVLAFSNLTPVGCGAIKKYDKNTMEIKRMYVIEAYRGRKIATRVLNELEQWTRELNYSKCILETGKKQVEAIQLYKKNNYSLIPNYFPYTEVENSLCFEKALF